VEARSWDPTTQAARVETMELPERVEAWFEGASGPEYATKLAPGGPLRVHPRPLADAQDAARAAQEELDARADTFVHIQGVCDGTPDLAPGERIRLKGVAAFHEAAYRLDRVQHRVDASEGYVTRFEIGVAPAEPGPTSERPLTCTPAVVVNTVDPKGLGRVCVEFRALGDDLRSHWLRVLQPGAGRRQGGFFTPHPGDEVLVLLESDDLDAGYVLGGLYSPARQPASSFRQAPAGAQGIESAGGHRIVLDDHRRSIEVQLDPSCRVELRRSRLDGDAEIKIHAEDSFALKVDAGTNSLALDRRGARLRTHGRLELWADQDVSIRGQSIKLQVADEIHMDRES